MAKIRERNPHAGIGHRNKPRGIKDKDFEKVYWPFLPVIFIALSIVAMSGFNGSLASYLSNPSSKVLSYSVSQDSQTILSTSNIARKSSNIAPLTLDAKLSQAADAKANDMANKNYWSHSTPDGKDPWSFATILGYSYQKLGENLATGFTDEQSVIKAWMASAPHRENLLDPAYTEVGFGFANAGNYTAAGGGPMTIVVAFYGRPASAAATTKDPSSSLAPSTDNSNSGQVLASKTLRSDIALFEYKASTWATTLIVICITALLALIAGKHTRTLKRTLSKGEKFIWKHPVIDGLLLIVIALLAILSQTAGYIQ